MQRADEIYTSGLETLVAESKAIAAGPVADYSKQITEAHTPSDTPLRWKIHGQIDKPEVLKGEPPPSPIRFTRTEQAVFLDQQPAPPPWASDYLTWQQDDKAIVFFTSGGPQVYPSGSGERDLTSLVRRIVQIQSMPTAQDRYNGWRDFLQTQTVPAAKETALRSIVALQVSWPELEKPFRFAMADRQTQIRTFAFGLLSYAVTHARHPDTDSIEAFLCDELMAESETSVVSGDLASFERLLRFENHPEGVSRYQRLRACLEHRCSQSDPALHQSCQEILARFAPHTR